MGATQLGALAFLLLCARLWPDDRPLPLTALAWRVVACAAITLLTTTLCNLLLLAPAQLGYLQWLLGLAVAAAVAVGLCAAGGEERNPGAARCTAATISLCVTASIVVLLAAQADPFADLATEAIAASSPRQMPQHMLQQMAQPPTPGLLQPLYAGARALFVLAIGLAAFGGLANRALAEGTWPARSAPRLLLVAVLALPIAGIAPWFAG